MSTDDRDYLGARRSCAHRRPARRTSARSARRWCTWGGRRSDQRPDGAALGRRRAQPLVPVLLRAAPAPRARLRRAQGHPRHPGGRGAAHAHRDLAAPAPHARVDQGLPVVARGRRPGHVPAEALQLYRPAAAAVGAPALPSDAAGRRGRRARGAATTRSRACRSRSRPPRSPTPVSRRRRKNARAGGSSRSTSAKSMWQQRNAVGGARSSQAVAHTVG